MKKKYQKIKSIRMNMVPLNKCLISFKQCVKSIHLYVTLLHLEHTTFVHAMI